MAAYGLGIVFLIAASDWYAVLMENKQVSWFTKPATMLALLVWLVMSAGLSGKLKWFGFALIFGLIGDIFLLLPHKFFIAGLVSFFMGHCAYLAGFYFDITHGKFFPMVVFSLLLALMLYRVAPVILGGLHKKSTARKMKLPVIAYMTILSLMVFFALTTLFRTDWKPSAAGLAASGALLFFCSDSMLAYREFVKDFPKAHFWVRITYHLAQIALASAAVLNFS